MPTLETAPLVSESKLPADLPAGAPAPIPAPPPTPPSPSGNGPNPKTRILILGGGFGGVYTTIHLQRLFKRDAAVEITLMDRDNFFLMTPLLFEAGSGVLEPRHAVTPIRSLLEKANFIEADLESVDLDRRIVRARQSLGSATVYELPYDHLVLSLGGVTNTKLIPGSEHALQFKTIADAIYLRNHVIDLFERASVERDPAERRRLLTFVVIGAGLVGVELIGELTEFLHVLTRTYRMIAYEEIQLHLLEAGPKVMPEMERDLADYAVKTLVERGVHVRTDCKVARLEPGRVHLPKPDGDDTEVLEGATLMLCAGVLPSPALASLPLAKDHRGKLKVAGTMRSEERPEIWAVGDCASIPDPEGKPYPPLAQHALREARVLAANIAAAVRHPDHPQLTPFVYKTLGMLASLGRYKGVGRVFKVKIKGFLAWWVWRSYYLMQMPQWSRRLRIMVDWTIALFFKNDIVKLDLGQRRPTAVRELTAVSDGIAR